MTETVVERYASAYLKLLSESESEEKKFNELDDINQLLCSNDELFFAISSKHIAIEDRFEIISDLKKKCALCRMNVNFLKFLIESYRAHYFKKIFLEIKRLRDLSLGIVHGVIRGSQDYIVDSDFKLIENYLSENHGIKPLLKYEMDERIGAGFRVIVENLQLDATINRQFKNLYTGSSVVTDEESNDGL
ncbi:MAG: F0F1 ATP synthase subunit delta [Bacteriovoracia bacterium]